jgi:hypothetical protein
MKKFIYSNTKLALEVLTDLNERITSTKKERPSGEIYHADNMNGNILKVDRGKSFKGHDASVSICHEGKKLFIHNKYFGGMVSSIYYTDSKTTVLKFEHTYDAPKWMEKKMNEIKVYHNIIGPFEFEVDNDTDLTLSLWGVSVKKEVEFHGLNMFGHKYNIHMLRDLQEAGSRFRKQFKDMDISRMVLVKKSEADDKGYNANKVVAW